MKLSDFKVGELIHPPNVQWVGEVVAQEQDKTHVLWLRAPDSKTVDYRVNQVEIISNVDWGNGCSRADQYIILKNQADIKKALKVLI